MSALDPLDEAFAALRASSGGASAEAPATRRAILVAATQRRRRSKLAVRVLVPIAAVLAVSSAWAAATGRLAHLAPFAASVPELASVSEPETPTSAIAKQPAQAEAPRLEPAPLASAPVASPLPDTDLRGAIGRRPPAPRAAHAPSAAATVRDARDAEERSYRLAHEAHFAARDPARALTRWDAYLSRYPRGRFTPEARYNRAIALIRLGRHDDARDALRPFARGELGGYRQAEATRLLEVLAPHGDPAGGDRVE